MSLGRGGRREGENVIGSDGRGVGELENSPVERGYWGPNTCFSIVVTSGATKVCGSKVFSKDP